MDLQSLSRQILSPKDINVDQRGRIITLPTFTTLETTLIESRAGAVRGNHYHLDESHLMYIVTGRMIYLEQSDSTELQVVELGPGESVVTPAGAAHCTLFPEDTVFVTLSDALRADGAYETSVVRIKPMHELAEVRKWLDRMPHLLLPDARPSAG
jgi:oxalate decarboxylase/phosphoglucose isomerase-like protein (cupin superfamily)